MWINIPVGFTKLLNSPRYNWNFATEPEDSIKGRSIPIPRGKTLGGSSSINGMLYVRGNPLDYDTWAQFGNRGWSYESVLPYFRKSEHFEARRRRNARARRPAERRQHGRARRTAGCVPRRGRRRRLSAATPTTTTATRKASATIRSPRRSGRRWSTARAFLDPARNRPNLRVETEAYTTRVLLEGRRAVGVDYTSMAGRSRHDCGGEVILAAGAVKSPHMLELSGIGQPELLASLGIEVKHELRGVGENYRDHFAPRMNWRVKLPVTLNEQTRGASFWQGRSSNITRSSSGMLTFTAGIVYGFLRTRPELAGAGRAVSFHARQLCHRGNARCWIASRA